MLNKRFINVHAMGTLLTQAGEYQSYIMKSAWQPKIACLAAIKFRSLCYWSCSYSFFMASVSIDIDSSIVKRPSYEELRKSDAPI